MTFTCGEAPFSVNRVNQVTGGEVLLAEGTVGHITCHSDLRLADVHDVVSERVGVCIHLQVVPKIMKAGLVIDGQEYIRVFGGQDLSDRTSLRSRLRARYFQEDFVDMIHEVARLFC